MFGWFTEALVASCYFFFLFVYVATITDEGRTEAARGWAGKELGGQAAAEVTSPEPKGRFPETAKLARNPGKRERNTNFTGFPQCKEWKLKMAWFLSVSQQNSVESVVVLVTERKVSLLEKWN